MLARTPFRSRFSDLRPPAPRASRRHFSAALLAGCALLATSAGLAAPSQAQAWPEPPDAHEVELSYYLPASASIEAADYDPAIPEPSQVLGFEVGEWHVRHDLLVRYMEAVAEASDRVTLEVTGQTHEARRLVLLTITSPENHARIDSLRKDHLALSSGNAEDVDTADMPVVVNMGYSVHGNEPSGSNASLLLAYHLAAARDAWTLELLDRAVILLDPSLNPDGLSRFAQWANMHRGRTPVADPAHREHREHWPNGRTNHYWFDLNRDWLLAQHPESQARLRQFHAWRPNVLTDFHEMGTGSTYFFQPGVPSRKNPLTPDQNVELTRAFAAEHAEALDEIGSLYYTEESFDDFYYGKGSTYPDVHGAVGILFEQASSRGHAQETEQQATGKLTFPFTIRNQLTTSFSTLRAALDQRQTLLDYQRRFYGESLDAGRTDARGAFVFGDEADPLRTYHLAELLRRHQVTVHALDRAITVDGQRYAPGSAFVVPLAQPQYRLVRSLFETQKEFEDDTFYDVSTWTLPLAFGVPSSTRTRGQLGEALGAALDTIPRPRGRFAPRPGAVAYAFEWSSYYAPRALYRLLDDEARARVAKKPFEAETADGRRAFPRGTIVVPMGIQAGDRSQVEELLGRAAEEDGLEVHTLVSGFTPSGIDLGSPSLRRLERPKIALLVSGGARTYDAGEVWHLLDHRFGMETTLLDADSLGRADLDRYSHLVLVSGASQALGERQSDRLARWVRNGGVLITVGSSTQWASEQLAGDDGEAERNAESAENGDGAESEEAARKSYADYQDDVAKTLLGGTIFQVDLDLTHPLAYGYVRETLPVFRTNRLKLPESDDPYAAVAIYSEQPWLSGYASPENVERLAGSPAVLVNRLGAGTMVRLADNPNFRAYWYGTTKLFLNGLFFGNVVDRTGQPPADDEATSQAEGAHGH